MKKRVVESDESPMAIALNEERDSTLQNPSGKQTIPGRGLDVLFSIVPKNDASNNPFTASLDEGTQLVALITLTADRRVIYIGGVELVDSVTKLTTQMLQSNSTL